MWAAKTWSRSLAAVVLLVTASAAAASRADLQMISAYAQARAAGTAGDAQHAARGYAAILALEPDNQMLASRALGQAMAAGDRALAVRSVRILEKSRDVASDARLLLFAEELRTRDWGAASAQLDRIEQDEIFAFMAPLLRAWLAVDSGKGDPLALLAAAEKNPLAGSYSAEHRPFILIATGRKREGVEALRKLVQQGGGRAERLRIAAAALLIRKGDRAAALSVLEGDEPAIVAARRLVEQRKPLPGAIATAAAGTAEFLVRVAVDLHRQNIDPLALTFARLATFLAPDNSETWLVASDLLAAAGQPAAALALLANVPSDDPFAANAGDSRIRLLVASGEPEKALAQAEAAARGPSPTVADWTRLGDLYGELKRLDSAAQAYGQALALAKTQSTDRPLWTLHLLRGGVLEQAGRWEEARAELRTAYALAPEQPVVLNYLGYAQLERRENIDEAMRLIAEASKRQPDSAEITDSLGWAHYLRGDLPVAIALLERAVQNQPSDPAINEHLGDAYYSAGRRYEARYAWEAALLSAEREDAERLRAKIGAGLTPKLASP